jgi:hypothetical protein
VHDTVTDGFDLSALAAGPEHEREHLIAQGIERMIVGLCSELSLFFSITCSTSQHGSGLPQRSDAPAREQHVVAIYEMALQR